MKKISISELTELMHKGVVEFQYTKKSDGTVRTAKGTLMPKYIAPSKGGASSGTRRVAKFGYVTYWDVYKDAWRTFLEDNFIGLISSDISKTVEVAKSSAPAGRMSVDDFIEMMSHGYIELIAALTSGEKTIKATWDKELIPDKDSYERMMKKLPEHLKEGKIIYYSIDEGKWKKMDFKKVTSVEGLDVSIEEHATSYSKPTPSTPASAVVMGGFGGASSGVSSPSRPIAKPSKGDVMDEMISTIHDLNDIVHKMVPEWERELGIDIDTKGIESFIDILEMNVDY